MTGKHQSDFRIGFEKEAMPCLDKLYNFSLRLVGNEKIAYNLMRVTFVKALRFYAHLDVSIDFESWMLRIMRNTYLESFSKKLRGEIIDYQKIQIQFGQLYRTTDIIQLKNDFFDKLTEEEISVLLASLNDDFKLSIILCNVLGFAYSAIEDFTDTLPGIVRSRIHRGRKTLCIKLYNYSVSKGYIKNMFQEKHEIEISDNRNSWNLAALADGEMKNNSAEDTIRKSIEKEPGFLFEYNIQVLIKTLIEEKLKILTVPLKVKRKLERKISSVSRKIR